jgi:hypothetical protein
VRRAEIISDLLRRADQAAPGLLAADVAASLVDAGGNHLVIYVIDYEQETLQPVGLASDLLGDLPDPVAVAGTMAGRAFQTQQIVSAETQEGWRVWAPLRERAEQLGVLELGFAAVDEETLALCEDLGRLVGHLVRTAGRYTDVIEVRRRRSDMTLAAELQWDMLLPSLAFRCPDVAVAGRLEPAYEVGGDAFDYSLDREDFNFAFLDAMGHGVHSALASALVLAAYRHGRRRRLTLEELAAHIDEVLIEQFDGELFVTGHLAHLDVDTGRLRWINAGHPPPLLARKARVVAELDAAPCLPFGLGIELTDVGSCQLHPGDRLLFYSDGVVEAHPSGGDQYGSERLIERFERHLADEVLASETLRRVVKDVNAHRAGPLEDDASLMLVEWRPAAEPLTPPAVRRTDHVGAP